MAEIWNSVSQMIR